MPVSCSMLSRLATKPISTHPMAQDPRHTQWRNMSQSAYLSLSFDPVECSLPTHRRFSRWNQFAGMIALTQQSVKFWGASFSSITGGFSPRAIFEEGITSSLPGSLISSYVFFLTQKLVVHSMLIDSFVA